MLVSVERIKPYNFIFYFYFNKLFCSIPCDKNSTKKIEDEIFSKNENLRRLNKELEKTKLEFDFLSSAEKLIEFQRLYFDDELIKKKIQNIKIINNKIRILYIIFIFL